MAVNHKVVDLTTSSAITLNVSETDGNPGQSIIVSVDSGTAYIGGPTVGTAGTAYGFALASGAALAFTLNPGQTVSAIAAAGTVRCRVLALDV